MTETENDTAGILAPPPLIYGGCVLAGLGLDWLWPVPVLPDPVQYTVGGTLMAAAFALIAWVLVHFRRARTPIDPYKPTTALITDGPFRLSRNPAYVSLTLLAAGIGVAADSPWVLAATATACGIMHHGVIHREERYLEQIFGEDYARYKETVRRWV
jgi:protein-S-isoprenylcysteine O-methyltransferase Ste14